MKEEGKIVTVNDDNETGTMERTSDNTEFNFSIPNGSSITVQPGDLVQVIFAPTGNNEKRAIVIETGGDDK